MNFRLFSVTRHTSQTCYASFSEISFSCKAPDCTMYNPALILSDRTEIFIADTVKYSPEVESAVLVSDVSIRIYRIPKVKNLVLGKTFRYFFIEKKVSEILEKAEITLRYDRKYLEKIFSPIGWSLMGSY